MIRPDPHEQIRLPAPGLRDIVRRYVERRAPVDTEVMLALPVRPDLFIDFYFEETLLLSDRTGTRRPIGTDVLLVGPHASQIVTAHLIGEIHYFSIQLQPTALHRLVGLPMPGIVDTILPARAVLGRAVLRLRDSILRAADFDARIVAAERWFAELLESARAVDPVDEAARLVRHASGTVALPSLAARVALSERQWRRRFEVQTGLPPKLYARVARLDALLARRRAFPGMSWAEIAHRGGYSDQSHMLRDAKALLGTTPAAWLGDPKLGSHALSSLQSADAEVPGWR